MLTCAGCGLERAMVRNRCRVLCSITKAEPRVYWIEPMKIADVPEVSRVEARCFTNPWPSAAYRRELRLPQQNFYLVVRHLREPEGPGTNGDDARANGSKNRARFLPLSFPRRTEPGRGIVGFAGMWTVCDEAHITTIGVDPSYRGRGLGEWLLVHLIDEAISRNAAWLTLEVRVSNEAAQALYRKYGFTIQGTRKRYYSDDNEDAYIMWSPSLREPGYVARFRKLQEAIEARFLPLPNSSVPLSVPVRDSGT